jgi:hypothetical protein
LTRIGGNETMESRRKVVMMRVVSHLSSREAWFSTPTTLEGWSAAGFASFALTLGVLGEVARQGDVRGPFYSLAFVLGLAGSVAALFAVRRGERSPLAMLAFLPLLVGVSFGFAELLG